MRTALLFAASCAATMVLIVALFFHPAEWAASPAGRDLFGLVELLPFAVLTNAAVYTFTYKIRDANFWLARGGAAMILASVILAFR